MGGSADSSLNTTERTNSQGQPMASYYAITDVFHAVCVGKGKGHARACGHKIISNTVPCVPSLLCFFIPGLSLAWTLPSRLAWLARKPRDLSWSRQYEDYKQALPHNRLNSGTQTV